MILVLPSITDQYVLSNHICVRHIDILISDWKLKRIGLKDIKRKTYAM